MSKMRPSTLKKSRKRKGTASERCGAGAFALALLLSGLPALAQTRAPTPAPSPALDAVPLPVALNSCSTLRVALTEKVSSANARSGDLFHFKTLDPIEVNSDVTVPPEAEGIGVVSLAQHALRNGAGGFIALDPRYVMLPSGKVDVLLDRSAPSLSPTGKTNNIPGYVGFIPGIGWALGAYGFLHHGSDITIPVGASFRVFVGDLLTVSKCRASS
jgi:hypothetical protein